MTLDFNDEETRRQHGQLIAIFLANTEGDLINSARADWHIENFMQPAPSEEQVRQAATEYLVIAELIKAYREFYTDRRAA